MIKVCWIGSREMSRTVPANRGEGMEFARVEEWAEVGERFNVIGERGHGALDNSVEVEENRAGRRNRRFQPGLKVRIILPDGDRVVTLRWR